VSSPVRHGNPARRVECPAGVRNQLLARPRNRRVLGGLACPASLACLGDPGGLACRDDLVCPDDLVDRACLGDPASLASLVDRAYPADPACRGAMARPVARGGRACGRGRANGGRARACRDSRPCRRMR